MGTSNSFAAAAGKMRQVAVAVDNLPRRSGHVVGRVGKDATLDLARGLFGGDRRFSGARRSRSARRIAGARYRLSGDEVEIFPTGDPFYITARGRAGGATIRPRRRRALLTPDGPRATSTVGRLAPQPNLMDPAVREISRRAPVEVQKVLHAELGKVLR